MVEFTSKDIGDKMLLQERPLVFLDLETTGLNPDKHEIIEIACIIVNPETLEVKKRYHSKVHPKHLESADPVALQMNKFSVEVWKENAKSLKQVLEDINELAPGGIFVGYNVSFDRAFLEKAARVESVTLNFDYHWIDVMSLVYAIPSIKEKLSQFRLTVVCEYLEVLHKGPHRAISDVEATLDVFRCLVGRLAAI